MKIDASNYDLYLASINQIQQQNNQQNVVKKDEERKDSYIHSISSQDMAIPSGTYDANGRMVGELPPVTSVNTESNSVSDEAMAGGAGGGSGSDEDTTTTKVVTINGVTYLETTTTENGISTTTRTKISGTEED